MELASDTSIGSSTANGRRCAYFNYDVNSSLNYKVLHA